MIITNRFTLKKLDETHASKYYLDWFVDTTVKKFIINHPVSIVELKQYIHQCNHDKNILLLGIFNKTSQQHIGNIKFDFLNENIVMMGILIGEDKWRGRGVAAEVITGSALYIKEHLAIKIMRLGVDKLNISAIKSYEKLGFIKQDDTATGFYMDWDLNLLNTKQLMNLE